MGRPEHIEVSGTSLTIQAEAIFPNFQGTPFFDLPSYPSKVVSLFGAHTVNTKAEATDTRWATKDTGSFQVYYQRDNAAIDSGRFILSGTVLPVLTAKILITII